MIKIADPTSKNITTSYQLQQSKNQIQDNGQISDDEDNSWADDLTHSDDSNAENEEYYGEEEEYGDESINKGKAEVAQPEAQEDSEYVTKKKAAKRTTINVYCTEYDVVKKVARKVNNFKLLELEEDHEGAVRKGQGGGKLSTQWDISWHDLAISPDFLAKLEPYQKVSQFPGIYVVCRKNHLARNLMKMQRQFPKEYNFFPKTWLLPSEQIDFRNQFSNNPNKNSKQKSKKTFIVKPEAQCQGKGIFLTRSLDEIMDNCVQEGCVVQRYVNKPYLIDDLKFDLRIYVLLYGVNPLRIFIHDQGIARFATEEYVAPSNNNMDNLYMHLTNYAINKYNDKFQQNEDEDEDDQGHKRSLNAILKLFESEGHDTTQLMIQIKDIIVKTLVIGQPYLAHLYRSCQPEDMDSSMCFQILGFDILIDHKLKPFLLEVNQSPSFSTDSPLDYKIKKQAIGDAFTLLNVSQDRRKQHIQLKKEEMEKRILTGKTLKIGGEDREKIRQERLKERFEWEEGRTGGYELIFPSKNEERNKMYESFIQKANDLWDDFTTGGKTKKLKEQQLLKKETITNNRNTSKLQTQTTLKKSAEPQKILPVKLTQISTQNSGLASFREIPKAPTTITYKQSGQQTVDAQNSNKFDSTQIPSITYCDERSSNDLLIESITQDKSNDDVRLSHTFPKNRLSIEQNSNSIITTNPYQVYQRNSIQPINQQQQLNNSKLQNKVTSSNDSFKYIQLKNFSEDNKYFNDNSNMPNTDVRTHQKANSLAVQNEQFLLSKQNISNVQQYCSNQQINFKSSDQVKVQASLLIQQRVNENNKVSVLSGQMQMQQSSNSNIDKRTPNMGLNLLSHDQINQLNYPLNLDHLNKKTPIYEQQQVMMNPFPQIQQQPLTNFQQLYHLKQTQQMQVKPQNPHQAQKNYQQKSGTLIQIATMPIHPGQLQQNVFGNNNLKLPDSPTKKRSIPLPDLQTQSNRVNQIQHINQSSNQRIGNNINGSNNNNNNPNLNQNKKSSTSAMSHSPSTRPVKPNLLHQNKFGNAAQKTKAAQGQLGQLGNSFKFATQQQKLMAENQHKAMVQQQINTNQLIISQGKSLMPKVFDFHKLDDMSYKKQQANQREVEEALQHLEKQKQLRTFYINGIMKKQP